MSDDLTWLLLRKNNSFIVNRARDGPVFSKEPGNLRNLHSFKYSGLANSKNIHIADTPAGMKIYTAKKSPIQRVATTIRPRSGGRRSLGIVAGVAKSGYRPDLRAAALARVSALIAAQKEPKPTPPKKLRGPKAKAAIADA